MFVQRYQQSQRFRFLVVLLIIGVFFLAALFLSAARAQGTGISFNPHDWFASLAAFTGIVWAITHFLQAPLNLKGGSVRLLALLVGVLLGVVGSLIGWNALSIPDAIGLGIAAAGVAGGVNDGIKSAATAHGQAVGAGVAASLPSPSATGDAGAATPAK